MLVNWKGSRYFIGLMLLWSCCSYASPLPEEEYKTPHRQRPMDFDYFRSLKYMEIESERDSLRKVSAGSLGMALFFLGLKALKIKTNKPIWFCGGIAAVSYLYSTYLEKHGIEIAERCVEEQLSRAFIKMPLP